MYCADVSAVLGTGKSVTGAHLAFGFALLNRGERKPQLMKKPCVLYCGPSNKSVEVVLSKHVNVYICILAIDECKVFH